MKLPRGNARGKRQSMRLATMGHRVKNGVSPVEVLHDFRLAHFRVAPKELLEVKVRLGDGLLDEHGRLDLRGEPAADMVSDGGEAAGFPDGKAATEDRYAEKEAEACLDLAGNLHARTKNHPANLDGTSPGRVKKPF